MTPKSDAAYRSPVTSSRTRSVIGRSLRLLLRSVHVAVAPFQVTSNTCPGCAGVLKLYPEYEIHARCALDCGDGSPLPIGAVCRARQIGRAGRSDAHEVAAGRVGGRRRELRTI